jgi:hypothetical protein
VSYWEKLTDEQLQEELERNQKRLRCIDKKERAIAHRNIDAILAEQAKRFERRHGL